jgi:hypothetical protein
VLAQIAEMSAQAFMTWEPAVPGLDAQTRLGVPARGNQRSGRTAGGRDGFGNPG